MTYYIVSRLIGLFVVGCIVSYHIYRGNWKQQNDTYRQLLLGFSIMSLIPTFQEMMLATAVLLGLIFGFVFLLGFIVLCLNQAIEVLSEKREE